MQYENFVFLSVQMHFNLVWSQKKKNLKEMPHFRISGNFQKGNNFFIFLLPYDNKYPILN